jgi:2'-5' RNA ligase
VTHLGVAVPVPDPWGRRLQEYRIGLGDDAATGIPTHITLVTPFEAEPGDLPAIEKHLAAVAQTNASFEVHLRGTGTFRPVSPVVFVALVEGISQCELLAQAVRRGLPAPEAEFPYHPHVTVAHHLEDTHLDKAFSELAGFECTFTADHFSLYIHGDQSGWRPAWAFSLSRNLP